jgi:zinc protease
MTGEEVKRIIVVLLLCAAAGVAQDRRLSVPYTRFTLPNGLTVILHEDHTTPTVSVNIWYHVGSGREKPGRTGFAHLFEHIMFEGSAHVPEGKFDEWLEAAGGNNNGSTTTDRTNYYETVPSNALELPLFLESDRMGYLLPAMSRATVDGQRDVVKNERRQSYENRPYGMATIFLDEHLYPAGHPYHWPTIGYMKDLSAASYQDVVDFFKTYYIPNNASLCIAGDIDPKTARALVEHWFSDVPAGKPVLVMPTPAAALTKEVRLVYEDRVSLPRLYMAWLSRPAFRAGDAEMSVLAGLLTRGKNSRLYRRLVYDLQIAQDVFAYQDPQQLSGTFVLAATARSGHTLAELERVIDEEISRIAAEPPARRELERVINQYEVMVLDALESVEQKSDALNEYYFRTGNPDYFHEDLARFKALDPPDISAAAASVLRRDASVVLSVVPKGKKDLASGKGREVKP